MLFQIVQYAAISLVLISVVHYLIKHLTDNLTTPQVRDIVSSTNNHYEAIMKKLESTDRHRPRRDGDTTSIVGTGMPQSAQSAMPGSAKDDLKSYLRGIDGNSSQVGSLHNDTHTELLTYDSTESVFGDYDGNGSGIGSDNGENAYSTY